MLEITRVGPLSGWGWILDALRLFRRSPLAWLVMNLTLLFLGSALMLAPLVGPLVFALLTPVFMAGMMQACYDQEHGAEVKISHLFRGFRSNPAQLVTIGGVYLVGQILVAAIMTWLGGEELRHALNQALQGSPPAQVAPASSDRVFFALLVGSVLFVPLAMAVWFAPALVCLAGVPALRALRLSMQACVRNLPAMLVYSVVLALVIVLALLALRLALSVLPAALTFLKGFAALTILVGWVTVTLITVYTSYRELFAEGESRA